MSTQRGSKRGALSRAWNAQSQRMGRLSDYLRENGAWKLTLYCAKEIVRRLVSERALCRLHMISARPGHTELKRQREYAHKSVPLISIAFIPDQASTEHLHGALRSVLAQSYTNWELCVIGPSNSAWDIISGYAAGEPRIRAAGTMPSGDYLGFLDGSDELLPNALYEVVVLLNQRPGAGFIYSDYAVIDGRGVVQRIDFCPEFCRYFFLSHPYIAHFAVIRSSLVEQCGGVERLLSSGAPVHLSGLFHQALGRISDDQVAHISRVLYSTRRREIHIDLRERIAESMALGGIEAAVELGHAPNCYRLRPKRKGDEPLVSIIIPTKNKWELLSRGIESIRKFAGYDRYEIVVISNNTDEPEAVKYIDSLRSSCTVVDHPGEFNYSSIINHGVRASSGSVLCFLNDDVEFLAPDTLRAAVEALSLEGVGVAGGKLLYPDHFIQHAGVILGLGGIGEHWHKGMAAYEPDGRECPGYLSSLTSMREFGAVTGAFKLTWRSLFDELGGYDEGLRIGYNDIDYCLRAGALGYKVMYTPFALAYHHESASRRQDEDNDDPVVMVHRADNERFSARWKVLLSCGDRFYSPNLELKGFTPRPKL